MALTSPVITAIMQQMSPVWTCSISLLMRLESRSILKIIGIGFAVVGSLLTLILNNFTSGSSSGHSFEFSWSSIIGVVCFIINTFAYSSYLILQRHLLSLGIPPFTVTLWSFTYGLFLITIMSSYHLVDFALHTMITTSKEAWFGAVFGGVIGGTIAFTFQTIASKHLTPTIVSIYSTLLPVSSAILSYIFLDIFISPFCIIGAVLITIGVLLVAFARFREARAAKSTILPKQVPTTAGNNAGENAAKSEQSIEKVPSSVELATRETPASTASPSVPVPEVPMVAPIEEAKVPNVIAEEEEADSVPFTIKQDK